MKINLIGTGNTGQCVYDLAKDQILYCFNSTNLPNIDQLKQADVLIIFVPACAAENLIPQVLLSQTPAVWGTTGYAWPQQLSHDIQSQHTRWVIAPNFSLSMVLIKRALRALAPIKKMCPHTTVEIKETHHIHKKDRPSGTAYAWQQAFDYPVPIESIRKGEVIGQHKLSIDNSKEIITLTHQAKNRTLFAQGALWAAQQICSDHLDSGLYTLEDLVNLFLQENPSVWMS